MGAAHGPHPGPAQRVQGFPRGTADLKRFKDTGPTTFSGTGGSIQAEEWLRHTEKLPAAAEVTPARKVEIVRLQLTDLARQWWASEADSIIPRPIPWETFVASFLIRYFPASERSELQRKIPWTDPGDQYS